MLIVLLVPFLGTLLGSAMVFFIRGSIDSRIEKILLGFAAGVMTAASVWSLLIPALSSCASESVPWLKPALGFLLGIFFLLVLDSVTPHLHLHSEKAEGRVAGRISRTAMLVLAVTLHNIPEGMSVGITWAASSSGEIISRASAFALAVGIAIQNFPEGAIISMPLLGEGKSRTKAFLYGTLSGAVEPVGAFLTIVLSSFVTPILPLMLSFAAGAMIYVVTEELIPESQNGEHSNLGTVGVALGFVVMMVLDVAFG